ncbi:hypothetical protein BJV82DRAFT_573088 [Fennellomyces sp. T-0311]|nr:hypothetical protein BJV82DRAFT_573088 [Fennellomyces sp. T-0311]
MDPNIFIKNPVNGLLDFHNIAIDKLFGFVDRIKHSQNMDKLNLHRARMSLAQRFAMSLHMYIAPGLNKRGRYKIIRGYVKRIGHPYLSTNEDLIQKTDQEIMRIKWRTQPLPTRNRPDPKEESSSETSSCSRDPCPTLEDIKRFMQSLTTRHTNYLAK